MSGATVVRIGISAVAALAAVATLLVISHPAALGCPGSAVSPLVDCRLVVSSAGGRILGVHLGVWALVWIGLFWVVRLQWSQWGWALAILAFLGVAYAVGTELRVGHLCAWCTVVQASLTALAILTLVESGEPAP